MVEEFPQTVLKWGSATDITLCPRIEIAPKQDMGVLLARAIWMTSEDKSSLLEAILQPFIENPDYASGWQRKFLDAILMDPHDKNVPQKSEEFEGQYEEKLAFIFRLLKSSVKKTENAGENFVKAIPIKRIRIKTKKRNEEEPDEVLAINEKDQYVRLMCIVLLANDILRCTDEKQNEECIETHTHLRAYLNKLDCIPRLDLEPLTLTCRGRKLCFLDPTQQKVALLFFCIQTIIYKIEVHIKDFIVACKFSHSAEIISIAQNFSGFLAVELLKCFVIFSSVKEDHWKCNTLSFTEYMLESLKMLSLSESCCQEITSVAEKLDETIPCGPLVLLIRFLTAFGLASFRTEPDPNVLPKQPISFSVNPTCADILRKTWTAASSFHNRIELPHSTRAASLSEHNLSVILQKRRALLDEISAAKQLNAGPCGPEGMNFLRIKRKAGDDEVRLIVEQSFQVFVTCPDSRVRTGSTNYEEITIEHISCLDTRHSVPLQLLSQFVDLRSILSNGGSSLKDRAGPHLLVVGSMNKSSIMRGLRLGMTSEGILEFLQRYSAIDVESALSSLPSESTFNYNLPDIVVRQIQFWGVESRRLTYYTLKKNEKDLSKSSIAQLEDYSRSSYWWMLFWTKTHHENSDTNDSSKNNEEIPIILGGLTEMIQPDENASSLDKKESELSRKQANKRKLKMVESYPNISTASYAYGDEVLHRIRQSIRTQYFIRVSFDSAEERNATFGKNLDSENLSIINLTSNIPHQKNYRFICQIEPLVLLAAVDFA